MLALVPARLGTQQVCKHAAFVLAAFQPSHAPAAQALHASRGSQSGCRGRRHPSANRNLTDVPIPLASTSCYAALHHQLLQPRPIQWPRPATLRFQPS